MNSISIIIPCYNEQDNIERLCLELRKMFDDNTQYIWKVILIDDGSTDGTKKYFSEAAEETGATLLTHEVNRGKGAALKTAFHLED